MTPKEDHTEGGEAPAVVLAHKEQPADGIGVDVPPVASPPPVEEVQQLLEENGFTDAHLVQDIPEGLTRSSLLKAISHPGVARHGSTARMLVSALQMPAMRLKYTGSETFLPDLEEACSVDF